MSQILFLATIFAQNAKPQGREGNFIQTIIMLAIAVLFFYFILWRPERKRRKALEQQRETMKKGDRITAMGLVGTIDKIQDKTVIVKMVEGAKVEILKAAITEVQPAGEKVEEAEKSPS